MSFELTQQLRNGVTLLGNSLEAQGVTLAFTTRTGGVSEPPYASLNLGTHVGDKPAAVQENRRRVLAALGAEDLLDALLVPNQVHGSHVARVRSNSEAELTRVRAELAEGADAVVCVAPEVPVLLCYADCVPVVLAAPGGFAVVHSGWKGTIARIAAKAARALCEDAGCAPEELTAAIGPHIRVEDYEVSPELCSRFEAEFGPGCVRDDSHLNLSFAVRAALLGAGVPDGSIVEVLESTASHTEKFFSYRAEGGTCGRHAAVALLRS